MKPLEFKTKYQFTPKGATIYYIMLLLMLGIFMGRILPFARLPILMQYQIYPHISNFVISYVFTSAILLMLALQNARRKYMFVTVLVVMMLNLLVQRYTSATISNNPDMTDAIFGTSGATLALIIILFIKTFGLKETY